MPETVFIQYERSYWVVYIIMFQPSANTLTKPNRKAEHLTSLRLPRSSRHTNTRAWQDSDKLTRLWRLLKVRVAKPHAEVTHRPSDYRELFKSSPILFRTSTKCNVEGHPKKKSVSIQLDGAGVATRQQQHCTHVQYKQRLSLWIHINLWVRTVNRLQYVWTVNNVTGKKVLFRYNVKINMKRAAVKKEKEAWSDEYIVESIDTR